MKMWGTNKPWKKIIIHSDTVCFDHSSFGKETKRFFTYRLAIMTNPPVCLQDSLVRFRSVYIPMRWIMDVNRPMSHLTDTLNIALLWLLNCLTALPKGEREGGMWCVNATEFWICRSFDWSLRCTDHSGQRIWEVNRHHGCSKRCITLLWWWFLWILSDRDQCDVVKRFLYVLASSYRNLQSHALLSVVWASLLANAVKVFT
jgi:hypothetical protein